MSSLCDDSDAVLYDWNSDDEPPQDQILDLVVVSHDGEVHKRIVKIGTGWCKPGSGDIVTVRYTPVGKTAPVAALANDVSSSASPSVLGPTNTSVTVGYNSSILFGIEEAVRTMKKQEVALVSFPIESEYSHIVTNSSRSYSRKREKYDAVHRSQIRTRRAALRREEAKAKKKKMMMTSAPSIFVNVTPAAQQVSQTCIKLPHTPRPSDGYPLSEAEAGTDKETSGWANKKLDSELIVGGLESQKGPNVSQKDPTVSQKDPNVSQRDPNASQKDPNVSPRDPNESQKDPSVSQRDPSVSLPCPIWLSSPNDQLQLHLQKQIDALQEDNLLLYLVELIDYRQIISLTENRGVLKEVLKKPPLYKQSPRAGDFVTYRWRRVNDNNDGVDTNSDQGNRFQGFFTLESCPVKGLFTVIQSMREGENCLCILKDEYTLPSSSSETETLPQSPCESQVSVTLEAVYRVDVVDIADPRTESSLCRLTCYELISRQSGVKQQLAIETGCRVLVFLSIGLWFPSSSSSHLNIFPFLTSADDTPPTTTAGLVSWTVGVSTVPIWLDAILMSMRLGQRLQVELPKSLLTDEALALSQWDFYRKEKLDQNNKRDPDNKDEEGLSSKEIADTRSQEVEVKKTDCKGLSTSTEFNPSQTPIFTETVFVVNTPDLSSSIESWNSQQPACLLPGLDRRERPIDVQHVLEDLTQGHWDSTTGDITQVARLRERIAENAVQSHWMKGVLSTLIRIRDSTRVTPRDPTPRDPKLSLSGGSSSDVREGESDDDYKIYLDLQLIEVLERVSSPWTLTEDERLTRATEQREFGNFLLKKGLFNFAITFYNQSLDVLRFCESQDQKRFALADGKSELLGGSNYEAALDKYAERVNEGVMQTHLNVALARAKLEQWRESLTSCEASMQHGGASNAKCWYRMAAAQLELDQYDEARESIQRSLAIDAENATIKNFAVKIDRAIRLARAKEENAYKGMFSKKTS